MSSQGATSAHWAPQQGRSLLELMIALVIGFIILGAVLLTSVGNGGASRRQNSVTTLNEDAAIATTILTNQLRLAGYSRFRGQPTPNSSGSPDLNVQYRNYNGPPVRGCDGGMRDYDVGMSGINCANGDGADGFMVAYEANTLNTFPTRTETASPTDCLGATLPAQVPSESNDGSTYFLAENFFYVDQQTNSLMCSGSGNPGSPQPLIGNVVDMQVLYGVAAMQPPVANVDPVPLFEAQQYLTATEVDQLPVLPIGTVPPERGRWVRVVSMRVCLVLQSEAELYDTITPYAGCNGQMVEPADRRAYRAVTVTTAFKNRTAPCNDPEAAPSAPLASSDRCSF